MTSVGKVLLVLSVIMVIFHLAGISIVSTLVLDYVTSFADFKFENFFDQIWGTLIGLGVVGSIVIGAFSPQRGQYLLLIGYSLILLAFTADIVAIWILLNGVAGTWYGRAMSIVLIPLGILYVHAVMSWWGQRGE